MKATLKSCNIGISCHNISVGNLEAHFSKKIASLAISLPYSFRGHSFFKAWFTLYIRLQKAYHRWGILSVKLTQECHLILKIIYKNFVIIIIIYIAWQLKTNIITSKMSINCVVLQERITYRLLFPRIIDSIKLR